MADSKAQTRAENTCQYCLYLKPPPGSRHSTRGNCSLHKEWIDSSTRTTCSEMSKQRLQRGIYQLTEQTHGQWLYIRRKDRIRTRLFLVLKSRGGSNWQRRSQEKPTAKS